MRIFEHMNTANNDVCPVCKTQDDKPVVLVGVDGTEEGNVMKAIQVHVDCIDLRIMDLGEGKVIYHKIK